MPRWPSGDSPGRARRRRELIAAGLVTVDGQPGRQGVDPGADDAVHRGRDARPLREPGGAQAHRGSRRLRRGSVAGASRSTSARRPAASPRCCSSAAPAGDRPRRRARPARRDTAATIRVVVVEGFNAPGPDAESPAFLRHPASWRSPDADPRGGRPFVHLAPPVLRRFVETARQPDADYVVLVKPQFEVGRSGIREGIVRDRGDLRGDARHERAVGRVGSRPRTRGRHRRPQSRAAPATVSISCLA